MRRRAWGTGAVVLAMTTWAVDDAPPPAAPPLITASRAIQISVDRPTTDHDEISIVADPTRANRLAACVTRRLNEATHDEADSRTMLYVSDDTGQTWRAVKEDSATFTV